MLCRGPGPAWLVVYTAARGEIAVRDEIMRAGFAAWTPLEKRTIVRRGKKREMERPYFSRYVFAGVDVHRQDWQVLLDVDGVEDVLRNNGSPSCVPSAWIATLRHAEAVGAFDCTKPEPNGFELGERVRIGEGQFSGFHAVIKEFMAKLTAASPRKRAKVLFTFMGRMTALELPVEHLEKA